MLETDIKRAICDYLASRRVFFWIQQAGKIPGRINRSRYLRNGVSDILGIFGGKFLAIEVKTKTGKLSPDQVEFLASVKAEGGIGFVARSVEDVKEKLEGSA